mmetsp:Transcript_9060/g.13911  ORF Transcript_9060/g.13911 Transcript_9060/m.13911 type:complete len:100 (-) Transcript_9060:1694-1993(-)
MGPAAKRPGLRSTNRRETDHEVPRPSPQKYIDGWARVGVVYATRRDAVGVVDRPADVDVGVVLRRALLSPLGPLYPQYCLVDVGPQPNAKPCDAGTWCW